MPRLEPERLLDDLDPEQREAVLATSGPVAILAGAGTGKTRVISRRTAYAIATEVVPPDQVLVVTFTDKAAGEMVERLRSLGLPGVTARTFHAHALSQLRHFWPSRHDGAAAARSCSTPRSRSSAGSRASCPATTGSRRRRTSPTRSSGRSRAGSAPRAYEREVARVEPGREPPIPVDLFVRHLRELRARQDPPGPDRLRRPARRDRRACSRTTPTPPRPSAPGSAGSASTSTRTRARSSSGCSSCGWAIAGPVRRRRRRPDDLHVHRRDVGLPDRRSPSAIRAPGSST